jgi:hypothetical protein
VVLGLGHLDGTDIPFTLGAALTSWALLRWLRRRDTAALAWLGLAVGVAAGTQVTGLLVAAVALAVVAAAEWRSGVAHALARTALAAVIGWAVVWAVYLALDPALVQQLPLLVPRPYLEGARYLSAHDDSGSVAYIAGVAYTGGRWWYWPLSLVVKWPWAGLVLLVGGVLGGAWLPRDSRRRAAIAVGMPAVALTAVTLVTPKDVGLRYLLPALALWAAAAGSGLVAGTLALLRSQRKVPAVIRRAARPAIAVLAGATIAATAASFPGSIAWTAGPFRPGYPVATDSNLDWGQDLYTLRTWSASHDPWVAYFGPRGIATADIPGARPLLGTALARVDGWVAVSVTALNSANRASLSWLRAWCPVGILAGTILIYHFSRPPEPTSALRIASRPAPLCPGRWSSAR